MNSVGPYIALIFKCPRYFFPILLLIGNPGAESVVGEIVFDTYDGSTPAGGTWGDREDLVAQPFLLGDNDTIASVLVGLGKFGFPFGTIEASIWDAKDDGYPNEQVGVLGIIDIEDTGRGRGDVVFDDEIGELVPNQLYFLVLEWSEDQTLADGMVWDGLRLTEPRSEANGDVQEAILLPASELEWLPQSELGGPPDGPPFAIYHLASIKAFQSANSDLCDFNGDGLCDVDDLSRRSLYGVDLVEGSSAAKDVHLFDLTKDGVVNTDDLEEWLDSAAVRNGLGSAYLQGDTNLDGRVDFADFLTLSDNFGKTRSRDWNDGDFTGDRAVDFEDFLALGNNFGNTSAVALASVPEPFGRFPLAILCVYALLGFRLPRFRASPITN